MSEGWPTKPPDEGDPWSRDEPEALRASKAVPLEGLGKDFDPEPPPAFSLRIWHLIVAVALVAGLCWLCIILGAWVIPLGIIAGIGLAVGGIVVFIRYLTIRQDSLLSILAIATERGLPLSRAIVAFADHYHFGYARKLRRLAVSLETGSSLSEALREEPGLVSRDALLLVRAGEASGQLSQALRMASVTRSLQVPTWTAIASRLAYLVFLLTCLQAICGFLLYFIVPKMEAIFRDFGITLPSVTITVIESSHFIAKYLPFFAYLPLFQIALLLLLPAMLGGWINGNIPMSGQLFASRHQGLIMRALSLFVTAGKPVESGLALLAAFYPTRSVRRSLADVYARTKRGQSWIDGLREKRLVSNAGAEVLRAASSLGNLGWVLQEFADTGERRSAYRFKTWVELLFPLVIIGLGICVFLLAAAFFTPLVELIRRLSG